MKHKSDPEIGKRAAEEILRKGCSISSEFRRLGLSLKSFYVWNNGTCCPDSTALQALARGGYDVVYILTGERNRDDTAD